MKINRIVAVVFAAITVVSCLDTGTVNKYSYPLHVSFDFDEYVLKADSLYFDDKNGDGIVWMSSVGYWNDLFFGHKTSSDKKSFLGGFILSGLSGSESGIDTYYDSFRVNSGSGFEGSPIYAVFYDNPDKDSMPEKHLYFIQKEYGTCTMAGCYVNNTTEVVNAVKEKFTEGDKLTLKVTGYLGETKTGDAQIALADYATHRDSVVVNWTPFKLDKLGAVDRLEFSMQSTKEDIPLYFCMDSMIAYIYLEY